MNDDLKNINSNTFRAWQRNIPLPLKIDLGSELGSISLEHILRIIPQKRLVASATWGNKKVLAKLFYAKYKSYAHAQQEINNSAALIKNNILTPRCLAFAILPGKLCIIIYEYLADTHSSHNISENTIALLAKQHACGLMQRDLHLNNFLQQGNKIFTIDTGSFIAKKNLSRLKCLNNFALLLAQSNYSHKDKLRDYYKLYLNFRGWEYNENEFIKFSVTEKKLRDDRYAAYMKKILRTNSQHYSTQSFKELKFCMRSELANFQHFFAKPESYLRAATILKDGNSATVSKITIGEHNYVIKFYNIKDVWNWLRKCLRPTRACNSWLYSNFLTFLGISTPHPVAAVEHRFFFLRSSSYFIMQHCDGETLANFFTNPVNKPHLEEVAHKIMHLFQQLLEANLTHGDLKQSNIIIRNKQPMLVDLDSMKWHKNQSSCLKAWKKDQIRFMKNWQNSQEIAALFHGLL